MVQPCNTPGYRTGFSDTTGPVITPGNVIYNGLYRYNAQYEAVPDLADGPCIPEGDGSTLRCRLVETTFHDGTPVTADDVAYSYELQGATSGGSLKQVQVVDPRTVDFVLSSVDPTFVTDVMPWIVIVPRHAIEATYATFVAKAKGLKPADLTKLADTIDSETGGDPPVCTPRLDKVAALLDQLSVQLYREDFSWLGHPFDPCGYMQAAKGFIRAGAEVLDSTGMHAVSLAFGLFGTSWHTIGAGPYALVSEDATRVHLEAWPGYHGGIAATRYLDFVPAKLDGSDLIDGRIDISQDLVLPDMAALQAAARPRGIQFATPPGRLFYALVFNARPGRMFADIALRKALQLCIDLPHDLEAVTGPGDTEVYGPIPPGSWAYDPTIRPPARNPAAARALIEAAGWQRGADGIYVKGVERLAAQIVVRDWGVRSHMADLIADQARGCGMDLHTDVMRNPDSTLSRFLTYPHDIPGTHTPFDLYIGGFVPGVDPADALAYFISSNITDAQHPDSDTNPDFSGFADPVLDQLAAAARSTYDQAERAPICRHAQQEIAAMVPYIFLWTEGGAADGVGGSVMTVDGPLDLTALYWSWRPERMVVAISQPYP